VKVYGYKSLRLCGYNLLSGRGCFPDWSGSSGSGRNEFGFGLGFRFGVMNLMTLVGFRSTVIDGCSARSRASWIETSGLSRKTGDNASEEKDQQRGDLGCRFHVVKLGCIYQKNKWGCSKFYTC
jgi:hypothetical protein